MFVDARRLELAQHIFKEEIVVSCNIQCAEEGRCAIIEIECQIENLCVGV